MERFADLDELVVGCRTLAARGFIGEALAAYRAGAFRASVTATWVAVVFDLIDKLRELAIARDAEALREIKALELIQGRLDRGDKGGIEQALQFERGILELVRDKFHLLDAQQYTDMTRLKEDRNRCAHPTFQHTGVPYQPPAESVRSHLRNAMVHVLHLPPVQGRAALQELRDRVSSSYFPASREDAKTSLLESSLARPTEALVRGAVDELIFGFFQDGDSYHHKKPAAAALGAVIALHPAVAQPRAAQQIDKIGLRIDDGELHFLLGLLSWTPELLGELHDPVRLRIENFVRTGPSSQVSKSMKHALQIPGLRDLAKMRINGLDADSLADVVKSGVMNEAVERAVELYTNVKNWDSANDVARKLILPLQSLLTRDHIERILRSPREHGADLVGSSRFQEFINQIREDGPIPATELDRVLSENGLAAYASKEVEATASEKPK